MAKFKDFGSGPENKEKEPISFKIMGEEFNCVPSIQGRILLDIVADAGSDDAGVNARVVNKFFSYVLEDESLERFNALTEDKHRVVTVETLSEIVGWLVEQYTSRPEAQPEV